MEFHTPHPSPPVGLVKGAADLLVLQALSRGISHGFAISKWIASQTEGALAVEDAALYQALHRLERKALVEAEWGVSDTGRKVRLYTLTPGGESHLRDQRRYWRSFTAALALVLEPTPS
jgi:transcriptional regulator